METNENKQEGKQIMETNENQQEQSILECKNMIISLTEKAKEEAAVKNLAEMYNWKITDVGSQNVRKAILEDSENNTDIDDKYSKYIYALEYSPLASVRHITKDDKYSLIAILKQAEKYFSYVEDNLYSNDIDILPIIYLNALTIFFGESCLPIICYIQPVEKQTDKFFLKPINGDLRSSITKAEIIQLIAHSNLCKNLVTRNRFGIKARLAEITSIANSLRVELDSIAIERIAKNAKGVVNCDISQKCVPFRSINEKIQTLKLAFKEAEQNIINNLGVARVTNYIAGSNAFVIMKLLDGFVNLGATSFSGPHLAGTLNGCPVMVVPEKEGDTEFEGKFGIGKSQVICQYKGPGEFHSGTIWFSFIPLAIASNLLPMNNPLIEQGTLFNWSDLKVVNPEYATMVNIENISKLLLL